MVYVILINEFYTQPTNAFLVGVKKFLIKNLNIYTFPVYSNCVLSLKFLVLTHSQAYTLEFKAQMERENQCMHT